METAQLGTTDELKYYRYENKKLLLINGDLLWD